MMLLYLQDAPFKNRMMWGCLISLLSIILLVGCGPSTDTITPTAVSSMTQQNTAPQATLPPPETETPQSQATGVRLTLVSSPTPTAEATKTLSPDVIQMTLTASAPFVVISIAGVDVVECTAADCDVLATLKLGDMVHVIDTRDDWRHIMFDDGTSGFIPLWVVATPVTLPTLEPAITATPIPTVTNCVSRSNWPTYIVQAGETLSAIAARAQSTSQEIAKANCLASANVIVAGQRLYVPIPIISTPFTPRAVSATVLPGGDPLPPMSEPPTLTPTFTPTLTPTVLFIHPIVPIDEFNEDPYIP